MNYNDEAFIISKCNLISKLKHDLAIYNLKKPLNSSIDKELDNKYFANIKKPCLIKPSEESFIIKKDNLFLKVIYKRFIQKQITISDYNHADTSYVKYLVFLQFSSIDYKFFQISFLNETKAKNYYETLKAKINDFSTSELLKEIKTDLNKEISLLEKQLRH